jgi:hypothetical protein
LTYNLFFSAHLLVCQHPLTPKKKCNDIIIRFLTPIPSSLRRTTPKKEFLHTLLVFRHPSTPNNVFPAAKLVILTPIYTQKTMQGFDFWMTTPGAPPQKIANKGKWSRSKE